MPPPETVSPLDALTVLTTRAKKPRAAELDLEAARGLHLAAPIEAPRAGSAFPADGDEVVRAARDGFALGAPAAVDDERALVRADSVDQNLASDAAVRVACGDLLPPSVACVAAVDGATQLGSERVRIERVAACGDGLAGGARRSGPELEFPVGTVLDGRLEAILLARGVARVSAFVRPTVGVLYLGRDLVHPGAPATGAQVHDLDGFWLARTLEARGFETVELSDPALLRGDPARGPDARAFHRILMRCRSRKVRVLVICGGIGASVADGAAELVRRFRGDVIFERLHLDGCPSLLWAKLDEMDVVGLSGAPLACAAGFDLFLLPCLSAHSGVPAGIWDWRLLGRLPHRDAGPPLSTGIHSAADADASAWRLRAGRRVSRGDGGLELENRPAESPFAPVAAGGQDWILVDPAARDGCANWCPVALTASGGSL